MRQKRDRAARRTHAAVALAAVVVVVAMGGCASGSAMASRMPGNLRGWQRVLADDFTGRRLNTRIWHAYSGQPGGDPGGWWAPSHVAVSNGVLNLETYADDRYGGRWVSGGVSSAKALEQRYGKYMVRFRMDAGFGVAGVALLWPQSNSWPPEIDFAETGGDRADRGEVTATLHYGSDNNTIAHTVGGDFTQWHVMGVEWTPGRLVYTLDGHRWAATRSSGVPAERMELDIQTQAGTCGDQFAPCPDDTTPPKVTMQVDWVVAYRQARR